MEWSAVKGCLYTFICILCIIFIALHAYSRP